MFICHRHGPDTGIKALPQYRRAFLAKAVLTGLARVSRPPDMVAFIREHVYPPEYSKKSLGASKAA
jgi:hypothetical protein